jgi:hypothetical protein
MAFQGTNIAVPFGQGIDTKTDSKLVDGGKLLDLQNGVFTTGGAIQKRNGFMGVSPPTGVTIGNAYALSTFNNELLECANDQLFSYLPDVGEYSSKGFLTSVACSQSGVAQANVDLYFPDSANNANSGNLTYTVYAWNDTTGGVYISVYDNVAASFVWSSVKVASSGGAPRCVSLNNNLAVYYVSSGVLYKVLINVSTPLTPLSPVALHSASDNTLVAAKSSGIMSYVTFCDAGYVYVYTLSYLDGSLNTYSGSYWAKVGPSTYATILNLAFVDSLGVSQAPNGIGAVPQFMVVLIGNTTSFSYLVYATSAQVVTPITSLNTFNLSTGQNLNALTGCRFDNVNFAIYAEIALSSGGNPFSNSVTGYLLNATSGSISYQSYTQRGVGLGSEAFYYNNKNYIGLTYRSTLQGTFFVSDNQNNFYARMFAGEAGPPLSASNPSPLPSVTVGGTGLFLGAINTRNRLQSQTDDRTISVSGVTSIGLDFQNQKFSSSKIGENIHFSGGVLSSYDGTQVVEHGFHVYPEGMTASYPSLGVTVTQVGTSTLPQITTITPPIDIFSNGQLMTCAQQIPAGTYFTLTTAASGPTYYTYVFWFSIAGSGAAPSISGASLTQQISLLSTDKLNDVLNKIANAVGNYGSIAGLGQVSTTSTSVVFTNAQLAPTTSLGPVPPATAQYDFNGLQLVKSDGATTQDTYSIVTPAGSYITGGQYFILPGTNSSGGQVVVAFWYSVDGTGSAPAVNTLGTYVTQVISIHSNDGASSVAATTAASIAAYKIGGTYQVWTTSNPVGNEVQVVTVKKFPSYYTFSSTVGGTIPNGTYSYYLLYTWLDAQGQLHRSAPSVPLTINPASGVNRNTVTLTLPTLRLTAKKNVQLELYRTQNGTTVPQRITTLANATYEDSIFYVDQTTDTALASSTILYTATGELPNIATPPNNINNVYLNRIFINDIEDSTLLWYSKDFIQGLSVQFSDALTIRLPSAGGAVTAIANMDGKLLIFKATRIYYVEGSGPDAAGNQNNFTYPQLLHSDVGCSNQNSITVIPDGLVFQSGKGIYKVSLDLAVSYIGAPVESQVLANGLITSAKLLYNVNQVRFVFASGVGLLYDYFYDQWGTLTAHEAQSAVLWNNVYTLLRPDGSLRVETPGQYLDDNNNIPLVVKTAWIKPAGVQGYFRIRKLLFLGTYESPHQLQVQFCYNYDDTVICTALFDASNNITGASIYGQESTYGSASVYGLGAGSAGTFGSDVVFGSESFFGASGSTSNTYQFQVQPSQQKCESVRLTFTDISPSGGGNLGASLVLSNLNLEIAVRSGTFKQPGYRRIAGT